MSTFLFHRNILWWSNYFWKRKVNGSNFKWIQLFMKLCTGERCCLFKLRHTSPNRIANRKAEIYFKMHVKKINHLHSFNIPTWKWQRLNHRPQNTIYVLPELGQRRFDNCHKKVLKRLIYEFLFCERERHLSYLDQKSWYF